MPLSVVPPTLMMNEIPQIIPSARCLQCDVCCRFPEADSPLRPYFTREEIAAAAARGLPPESFPDAAGSRINLIAHPSQEGFICPAFDVATQHCRIYSVRPLDCRLYPFAVMRAPTGGETLLGWDRKCPYLREEADRTLPLSVSGDVARILQEGETGAAVREHPDLIGAFQEDVWVTEPLPAAPRGADPPPPDPSLVPFTEAHFDVYRSRIAAGPDGPLSTKNPVTLAQWDRLMRLWWTEIDDSACVVADQSGEFFLPVPPLGGDPVAAARAAFALLDRLNAHPGVSRIERIGESQKSPLASAGFVIRPQEPEYLYDRRALAALAGPHYKSHRWNANRAERRYRPVYRGFDPKDGPDCLRLYARWRAAKEAASADSYPAALTADSFYAHWRLLTAPADWRLSVRVAEAGGKTAAYTIGAPLDDDTFLILAEIADPDHPGLGPWLFRAFCGEMDGFARVNTMDDSGLASLRRSKQSYRPARLIPSYTAARAG
jgi:Fe-S-cluster containining protein